MHLDLYEGYVKHANLILETIAELRQQRAERNAFIISELRRRLGFEFDGMRMHEYYFEQLEGNGKKPSGKKPSATPGLKGLARECYGSWDEFVAHIKEVAGTRGIGWVVVSFDAAVRVPHTAWVNDHELGQLAGLPILLALDMWEHAFMVDTVPAEKAAYVEAFLENVNWNVVEQRLAEAAA